MKTELDIWFIMSRSEYWRNSLIEGLSLELIRSALLLIRSTLVLLTRDYDSVSLSSFLKKCWFHFRTKNCFPHLVFLANLNPDGRQILPKLSWTHTLLFIVYCCSLLFVYESLASIYWFCARIGDSAPCLCYFDQNRVVFLAIENRIRRVV